MIRAYKTEIRPTVKQLKYFRNACGISRFIYNWGLDQRIKYYKETQKGLTYAAQNLELTKLKNEKEWLYNVGKFVHQRSLMNLNTAFKNFFEGLKTKRKFGFPKFKSKHHSKNSFQIDNDRFYITKDKIKIGTVGVIKLKESGYIPTKPIKYYCATIFEEGNRWFISVTVEENDIVIDSNVSKEVIGVDLGIKSLAMCSDGTVFENPKVYKKNLKKLKKSQRRLSRKKIGSNNREKQRKKLKRIHYKISCIRKDVINKLTTFLARTKPRIIVIEDLNVKGMLKNHKLAQALSDISFGEIKRQLEYKALWYGSEVFVVDRFFPSSKLCSCCGTIKDDLKLSDRIYSCECGLEIDRDLNASINLKNYYLKSLRSARSESTPVDMKALVSFSNKENETVVVEAGTNYNP
jgi:putative transposase